MVVCLIFFAKIMIFANISDSFLLETVRWIRFFTLNLEYFVISLQIGSLQMCSACRKTANICVSDTFVCGLAVLNLSG